MNEDKTNNSEGHAASTAVTTETGSQNKGQDNNNNAHIVNKIVKSRRGKK